MTIPNTIRELPKSSQDFYGVILEGKASVLTKGNQCDWQESWGGFRGAGNC